MGKLAAVEARGNIWTSTDSGGSWTPGPGDTTATRGRWRSIVSSSDGAKLAAVEARGKIWTAVLAPDWTRTWSKVRRKYGDSFFWCVFFVVVYVISPSEYDEESFSEELDGSEST